MKTIEPFPIIVHSHLGWDWVWQRPQQFMSRLSARHPILFVEGPLPDPAIEKAAVQVTTIPEFPNVTVVKMRMPGKRWQDGQWVDDERRRQVEEILGNSPEDLFREPVQWFYDPMAVTAFAGQLNERAVVFDCMDQLGQFRGASAELVRREAELLRQADVVFAGGPSLLAKSER
jgi:hypothetical protein